MTLLCLLPAILSFLLLAVHFLRSENLIAVVASLLVLGLLWVRRPWVARLLQALLLLGMLEWVGTALALASARQAMGAPYLRLAIILGSVALFALGAALLFQTRRLKTYFKFDIRESSEAN